MVLENPVGTKMASLTDHLLKASLREKAYGFSLIRNIPSPHKRHDKERLQYNTGESTRKIKAVDGKGRNRAGRIRA